MSRSQLIRPKTKLKHDCFHTVFPRFAPATYPRCQRLVSRSHLSHITRLLYLLYFRRSLPTSGPSFSLRPSPTSHESVPRENLWYPGYRLHEFDLHFDWFTLLFVSALICQSIILFSQELLEYVTFLPMKQSILPALSNFKAVAPPATKCIESQPCCFFDLQCNEAILLENARLHGELQDATRKLGFLENHVNSLRENTVTFILEQMDALQMQKNTEV